MSAGIDYEALAKAAYESTKQLTEPDWRDQGRPTRAQYLVGARAVVAALRDQGFAVLRTDDLSVALGGVMLNHGAPFTTEIGPTPRRVVDAVTSCYAALVAAPGGGEPT